MLHRLIWVIVIHDWRWFVWHACRTVCIWVHVCVIRELPLLDATKVSFLSTSHPCVRARANGQKPSVSPLTQTHCVRTLSSLIPLLAADAWKWHKTGWFGVASCFFIPPTVKMISADKSFKFANQRQTIWSVRSCCIFSLLQHHFFFHVWVLTCLNQLVFNGWVKSATGCTLYWLHGTFPLYKSFFVVEKKHSLDYSNVLCAKKNRVFFRIFWGTKHHSFMGLLQKEEYRLILQVIH